MIAKALAVSAVSAALGLSACAATTTPNNFGGERTVFYNPYAPIELANGPVGPDQCDDCLGEKGRWFDGLFYPGAGNIAFDRNGNRIRLSRKQRRLLSERLSALNERIELERSTAEFNARQMLPAPVPSRDAPPISIPPATRPQTEAGAIEP